MTEHYHFPAEWAHQAAILITWPHKESAWEYMLSAVEKTYLELAKIIAEQQALVIQLHSSIKKSEFRDLLIRYKINTENCFVVTANSNDTWARDHGPISVIANKSPTLLNFHFNGWGNKFKSEKDNQLNRTMAYAGLLTELIDVDFVLEGGSLETNGLGTLLTTDQCLLNNNRNPGFNRLQIEQLLTNKLGVNHFLWLKHGHLEGDDTDAHIDTLARFCNETTIVFQGCRDNNDAHYSSLNAMKAELESFRQPDGSPYRLFELPFPEAIYAADGHRLPATYANFLITNQTVIVPVYADKADDDALAVIAELFPDRKTVALDARPLIEEHGSIHCITMQLSEGSIHLTDSFKLEGFND
jgi:agmatine deiminase